MSRGIRKQERQVGEAAYGAVRTLTIEREGVAEHPQEHSTRTGSVGSHKQLSL